MNLFVCCSLKTQNPIRRAGCGLPNGHGTAFQAAFFLALILASWTPLGNIAAAAPVGSAQDSTTDSTTDSAQKAAKQSAQRASEGHTQVAFTQQIRPLLAKRCFQCHGPNEHEAGLRLDLRERATAQLESGSRAIVPGKSAQSELFARVTTQDAFTRMPPEGDALTPEEVGLLRRWIDQGAEYQKHWAFVPPQRPELPQVQDQAWVNNGIDAFVLQRLEQSGLQPNPPASRSVLVRRLYHDLTGLPPTPEQVRQFVEDSSPEAYERLVETLLASPHYGERWARHWLDLVRFAETNSFERDGPKPNAWKYRDYVIRSFNEDKPYDQFIREQLAGDELDEVTIETLTGTGFYRLGIWDDEPADPLQARYDELDGIITTTSQVFLGLTVNCARCHEHKIDPIPQEDYYRMLAFFHGLTPYGTRGNQQSNNQISNLTPEESRRRDQLVEQEKNLQKQVAGLERKGIVKMSGPDQRRTEGPQRAAVLKEKLHRFLSEEDFAKYNQLRDELASVRQQKEALPPREVVLGVAKVYKHPPPTHVLARGNPHAKGKEVQPAFPTLFGSPKPTIPQAAADAKSSGRRRVLAEWIASPENMLTSRVMANRLWQFHFGRGLVRSPNNFGQLGVPPTHPLLLDWLASEFVRRGWSIKEMHRLIVTSKTYRMSSQTQPKALAADPENNLFWRFDMRRLSAEEIRDSVLAVTGELNPTMYGPGIYPKISREVLHGQSRPGAGWGRSSPEQQSRRSVYIHVKRSLVTPLLETFDFPDTDSTCEGRFATTHPGQSLALLNGEFLNEQAEALAKRLDQEIQGEPQDRLRQQVRQALWLTTCRPPQAKEIQRGLKLIRSLQQDDQLDERTALKYFCLVALNQNEFLYLD